MGSHALSNTSTHEDAELCSSPTADLPHTSDRRDHKLLVRACRCCADFFCNLTSFFSRQALMGSPGH